MQDRIKCEVLLSPDGGWDLLVNGRREMFAESHTVVWHVMDALLGNTAGVSGECREVAKAILKRMKERP